MHKKTKGFVSFMVRGRQIQNNIVKNTCHNIGLIWLKYLRTNVDSTKRYQGVEVSKYGYTK